MSDPRLWTAAPAVLLLLGVFFLVAGLRQMMRGRVILSLTTLLGGLALAALGFAVGVLGADVLTYNRLAYERPVAEVNVLALNAADKRYSVIVRPTAGPSTTCVVQGDEWLLSAKVQTWRPWLNVFGFDSTYTLDQLANKYADAVEANGKPITACALGGGGRAAAGGVPARLRTWLIATLQIENRAFGAANYMPLADGATYRVLMTQQGPVAEPANETAQAAVAGSPKP